VELNVAVIGCGLMGKGIIHALAMKSVQVVAIKHRKEDNSFVRYLNHELKKGRISNEAMELILANTVFSVDIRKAMTCDIVIEAINEDREKKRKLFSKLDEICKPETILVSNTSGISITSLAEVVKRKEKVIGMHFMSPVPLMNLVEIVRCPYTSDATVTEICQLAERMEKNTVVVGDSPGFVTSRLMAAYLCEALRMVEEGIASAETIDMIAKDGLGFPTGPLGLADALGLDIVLNVLESLSAEIDERFTPCKLLKCMVREGKTGKKNGEGFFCYKNNLQG